MLTIDANIQSVVEKYIKQWQDGIGSLEAAVIVMDPNTGEVLAMADSDRYDLNSPVPLRALRMRRSMSLAYRNAYMITDPES